MGCNQSTEDEENILLSERNVKMNEPVRDPDAAIMTSKLAEFIYRPTVSRNFDFNPTRHVHVIANKGHVSQDYDLVEPPLGEGAFGKVMKAVHRASGLERAVKIIEKGRSTPEMVEQIKDEVINTRFNWELDVL